jgi:predicted  nucleic acid-binding Zn-ribbon protein
MPHQCVRCNKFYEDGAKEILKGCSCGARLFFYIKKERLEEAKKVTEKLTKEEKKEVEKDVLDLVDLDMTKEKPIVLDLESIKIMKPGKYELDLVRMFKGEPLIFKLEEGKYIIDIPESFKKIKK